MKVHIYTIHNDKIYQNFVYTDTILIRYRKHVVNFEIDRIFQHAGIKGMDRGTDSICRGKRLHSNSIIMIQFLIIAQKFSRINKIDGIA